MALARQVVSMDAGPLKTPLSPSWPKGWPRRIGALIVGVLTPAGRCGPCARCANC